MKVESTQELREALEEGIAASRQPDGSTRLVLLLGPLLRAARRRV